MADEISRLGLDVSAYVEGIDVAVGGNGRLLNSNVAVLTSFSKTWNAIGEVVSTNLKLTVDGNKQIAASFVESGNVITSANIKITESNQTAAASFREYSRSYETMRRIQADVAGKKLAEQQQIITPGVFKNVKGDLEKAFGAIPVDASIGSIQRLGKQIDVIVGKVVKGEITWQELGATITAVGNKQLLPPNLAANKAVQSLTLDVARLGQGIIDLRAKSDASARKIASDMDKLRLSSLTKANAALASFTAPSIGQNVQADITKAFGTVPVDASQVAIQKLTRSMDPIVTSIAQGRATYQQFLDLISLNQNKKLLPAGASAELKALEKNIASVSQQLENLGKKSGANAASQLKTSFANANAALQGLTLPNTFQNIQADVTKIFGKISPTANTADIQRINVAMAQLAQSVNSGKVSYQQLLTQMDAVKGKKILPPDANEEVNRVRANLAQLATSLGGIDERAARLVITWEGLTRLFAVQTAHAVFARLINLLQEATKAASELGTKIALIQTITQDQPATVDQWTVSLRALSDELGKPIVELATASYEALSNQVTQGREDTEAFIRTAANFSRTVGATTVEGVNLLSTAVKGFGVDVNDAEKAASIFFGAIDYGRLTAAGFAQTLGRTAPIAKDLKISLAEVAAAQAALTLQGFNAEEAGTRLANVLLGLEKPSEKLGKFFATFGAKTGREFISSVGGFENALRELFAASKTGVVDLEALFPELRKLQGILGLSADSGRTFNEIFNKITDGMERYKKAQEITQEPFAKKFNDELNKVVNVFTVDFAQKFQRFFVDLSDLVGGFSNKLIFLTRTFGELAIAAGGFYATSRAIFGIVAGYNLLIPALRAISLSFGLIQISATGAASAASGFGIAIAGFTAGILIIQRLRDNYLEFLRETSKTRKIEIDADVTKFKENLKGITESVNNETDKWVQAYQQMAGRLTVVFNQILDKQKQTLKDAGNAAENSLKGVTGILEQGVRNFESAAKKARDASNEVGKSITEAQREQDERIFETQREFIKARDQASGAKVPGGLTGASSAEENLVRNRIKLLGEQAKAAAEAEAKDPTKIGQFERIIAQIHRLNDSLRSGYIEQATKISQLQNYQADVNKTAEQQVEIINQVARAQGTLNSYVETEKQATQLLIDLLNQRKVIQAKNATDLEEQARKQKVAVDNIIDAYKKFADFSFTDKETGKIKTPVQVEGQPVKSQQQFLREQVAELARLRDDVINKIKGSSKDLFESPAAGLKEQLGLLESFNTRLADLQEKLRTSEGTKLAVAETAEKIRLVDEETKHLAESAKGAQTAFEEMAKATGKTKDDLTATVKLANDLALAIGKTGLSGKEGAKLPEQIKGPITPEQVPNLLNLIDKVQAEAQKERKIPTILGETPYKPGEQNITLPSGAQVQLNEALNALKNSIKDIPFYFNKISDQEGQLLKINSALQAFSGRLDPLPLQIQGSSEAFRKFAGDITTNLPLINQAMYDFVAAARDAAQQLKTAPAAGKASGGLIGYYDQGSVFKPRGSDVIPAMLSPNEFVVSEKGTSMFLKELKLMNKGINPFGSYFQLGGPTFQVPQYREGVKPNQNTNNFGDIHVNVTDTTKNPNLASNIALQIKRELRRGITKF